MNQVAERRELHRSHEKEIEASLEKQAAELQDDLLKQYRNFYRVVSDLLNTVKDTGKAPA